MSDELPLVDFCEGEAGTESFLRKLYGKGGIEAVSSWIADNVKVPCRIRHCSLYNSPEIFDDVIWFLLQRLNEDGSGGEEISQQGNAPKPGAGFQYLTVNVQRQSVNDESFGIVFAFQSRNGAG